MTFCTSSSPLPRVAGQRTRAEQARPHPAASLGGAARAAGVRAPHGGSGCSCAYGARATRQSIPAGRDCLAGTAGLNPAARPIPVMRSAGEPTQQLLGWLPAGIAVPG